MLQYAWHQVLSSVVECAYDSTLIAVQVILEVKVWHSSQLVSIHADN
jgi:hypothetical protein